MRGGTYNYSSTITIQTNNNGSSSARKNIFAYNGEKPILNFQDKPLALATEDCKSLEATGTSRA